MTKAKSAHLVHVAALTLASLTSFASPGGAAERERQGFWIGFGGGWGSASADCDNCDGGEREGGFAGWTKLGGTLNERFLLGGEFNLWTKEQDGVTLSLYNVSATVTFYPEAKGGFFLKGGAGFALVDSEIRSGSATLSLDLGTGFGVLAGLGYDVPLGRSFSLTPAVNFYAGWPGDLGVDGVALRGWKQNVVELSIGLTFH